MKQYYKMMCFERWYPSIPLSRKWQRCPFLRSVHRWMWPLLRATVQLSRFVSFDLVLKRTNNESSSSPTNRWLLTVSSPYSKLGLFSLFLVNFVMSFLPNPHADHTLPVFYSNPPTNPTQRPEDWDYIVYGLWFSRAPSYYLSMIQIYTNLTLITSDWHRVIKPNVEVICFISIPSPPG